MAELNKIDSNSTGLRICEEASLGVLPDEADQVWYPAEPNSYSDFGGQIKTLARRPINASRQNQKGVTVDLDASGGFNQDYTHTNHLRLLRGFMFASIREVYDSQSIDNESSVVSAVEDSDDTYRLAYGDDLQSPRIQANSIVYASGFAVSANNGVNLVNSVTRAKAVGTLTLTGNAADTETVTIGTTVYTFESGALDAAYKVKVGATASDSIDNLIAAINADPAGAGTLYAVGTVVHPSVTAAVGAGDTMVVTANSYGYAGNAIATTQTMGSGTWGAVTLVGGTAMIDVAANLTDEASPLTASRVQVVGYEFAVGTLDVNVSNDLPRLTRASGAVDFTALGLVAGQFVYIGGDETDEVFVNEENNGWARIHSIAASYIELDKTTDTMVAETGTALTVRLWFSKVLKNETAESDLLVRRSFQIERDLGQFDTSIDSHQGEYLVGAVPNQITLNVKQADKLNTDMTFVAQDNEQVTQATGLKSEDMDASAPDLVGEDAFNTTSHVARLRMVILDPEDSNPSPLFGYLTEFNIVVNNNVSPNKAVSVLGAFELTAGQFDVTGKVTAYFSDIRAVAAVRDNSDVSLDFVFVRDNYGAAWDIPLTSLGDGRLSVEQDNPITLPLDMNAAADRTFNHTLLLTHWNYLPDVAMAA